MIDIQVHARKLGLEIEYGPLDDMNAVLLPGGHVVVNDRRSDATQRYALAHECGHWFYGHDWRREHDRERDERQADLYAARTLISIEDYARAERIAGSHVGLIARELMVPARLILLWREVNKGSRLPANSSAS